jgi:hypothetical protein
MLIVPGVAWFAPLQDARAIAKMTAAAMASEQRKVNFRPGAILVLIDGQGIHKVTAAEADRGR